jgi:hypothetical protein
MENKIRLDDMTNIVIEQIMQPFYVDGSFCNVAEKYFPELEQCNSSIKRKCLNCMSITIKKIIKENLK